jgi:hypothetical protein
VASDSPFLLLPFHHGSHGCIAGGQILPSLQLVPESTSMAGGGPNPPGNRYTHNNAAFAEYNTRLQSSNLPTFTGAASKFTEWLGSDKAYYPNARVPVRLPSQSPRRIPLIINLRLDRLHYRGMPITRPPSPPNNTVIKSAHANICRVQGEPSAPFTLDKALPGLDPWYQPYLSLLKQVGTHLNYFEPELRGNRP